MEALHENLKVKFFARYCVSAPPLWQAQWMECLASQGPIIVFGDFFEDWLYAMSFFCTSSFVAQVENAGLESTNACSRRGERCTTARDIVRCTPADSYI